MVGLTCVFLIGLAGCRGSAGATTRKATSTPKAVGTSTPSVLGTAAPTTISTTTAGATPTLRPSPTPTERAKSNPPPRRLGGAVGVLSASVTPGTVDAAGQIRATVLTSGAVSRVELYIGSGLPNAPAPLTYTLFRLAPGTWVGTGNAPSTGGAYHFSVGLYKAAGQVIHKDRDSWNIVVRGGSQTKPSSAQPLPVDIPLAVPFSFGSPVSAVFSALGKSISGSEVVSNALPNVSPSVVVQFYETQLPRAGWATSAGPPRGAMSFTISGTKQGGGGTRVCIVQFSGATVHVFYGTG